MLQVATGSYRIIQVEDEYRVELYDGFNNVVSFILDERQVNLILSTFGKQHAEDFGVSYEMV